MVNTYENGFTEEAANGAPRVEEDGLSARVGEIPAKANGSLEVKHNGTESSPSTTFEVPTAKLSVVKLTDYMKESLDKVAFSEGFKNYELNVDHGSAIGDGFVGLIYKVTIEEIDSDKKLAVVVKFPPENKARRDDFGAMELFKREVFVYNELLPEFVKFQAEKKIKESEGFFNFPKCYFAEFDEVKEESVIIMEDLKEKGCKMWDKYKPVNLEHTKLLVSALGRLHALSFALKVQNPELFEKFKGMDDFMSKKFSDENMALMMKGTVQRAADTLDANDVKRKKRVMNLADNYVEIMKEVVDPQLAEPYAVVGHGDCWSNNFMFQYQRGSPRRIVLLDWQISRYCSPVLDLVYFIFVCTDGELRANHFDEVLNIYHRSLKDFLDRLGGDATSQFPFTALLRQLKQCGKFGILMATMLVPMLSTKNEELPDMDFIADNMTNQDPEQVAQLMAAFTKGGDNSQQKMRAALIDGIRLGYY